MKQGRGGAATQQGTATAIAARLAVATGAIPIIAAAAAVAAVVAVAAAGHPEELERAICAA